MSKFPPCESRRHRWNGKPFLGSQATDCCTQCGLRRQPNAAGELVYAKLDGCYRNGWPKVYEWRSGDWVGPVNEGDSTN